MLYQQGLHRCTVFAQSLTVHFWIIRSTNQGVRYVWDPGPPVWDPGTHDTMGTAKADPQTTLSDSVSRNHKQLKGAVSLTEDSIPTQTPIRHNNSGKVKTVSLKSDHTRRLCSVLNTIPDNGSLINTHISSTNIINHGSTMITNIEVPSSSLRHYGVGTTLDQSRQYHRPPTNIRRGYTWFTYPSGFTAHESALRRGSQTAPGTDIHLHWIRRCGMRGATRYKWAVSTDLEQLKTPGPTGDDEALNPSRMWQNWTHLEGGGPINKPVRTAVPWTSSSASDQAATLRIIGTADIGVSVIPARAQTTDTPPAQPRAKASPSVPLASMTSLRGPQARRNRANVLAGVDSAPSVSIPTGIRYPHNSKKWQLGVENALGKALSKEFLPWGKGRRR
jgi:hypothetical protein